MSLRKLSADEVGLPRFAVAPGGTADTFALSSHHRAREALAFGLGIPDPGFNVFVVGEDHAGRMTATLGLLNQMMADRATPPDWVYINNFRRPHRPKPYRLPAGMGRRLRDRVAALLPELRAVLKEALTGEDMRARVRTESETARASVGERMAKLRDEMRPKGFDIGRNADGQMSVVGLAEADADTGNARGAEAQRAFEAEAARFGHALEELNRFAGDVQAGFVDRYRQLERDIAERTAGPLLDEFAREFADLPGLARWIVEFREDVLDNLARFRPTENNGEPAESAERHYLVNLFIDHADEAHPSVVLEPNPTYENLFGRIHYRQTEGAMETDYQQVSAGALHRANGGVLVLRAESLAANPTAWEFLKAALRDRAIRVEELHRAGTLPIAGAPRPKEIPLDLKVVVIGSPHWYYTFFSVDAQFRSYFKVKADIDGEMDATPENLRNYAALLGAQADAQNADCDGEAIGRLLGTAARWAAHRKKLTAQFELIGALLAEARSIASGGNGKGNVGRTRITEQAVASAQASRNRRNGRVEDRLHEGITERQIIIDTRGAVVGQINALTVRDLGDHAFGTPSRVTARGSVGRIGVTNIERETMLGGAIQQKGVMVLQGFLAGHFARRVPMSFNCSITFEQSYGGVEGDSASVAELLAILSDLSGLPVRQDLAVTGSVNQRGQVQAVGGVHHKVEGFFRTCSETELTGTQGVVLPEVNAVNLILRDDIAEAVRAGRFHLWTMTAVEDAIELFLGVPPGEADGEGDYPSASVYGRVTRQLAEFDRELTRRRLD